MNKDDNRNMFIFIALSMVILVIYQIFVVGPQTQAAKARLAAQAAAAKAGPATPAIGSAPKPVTVSSALPRDQALGLTPRVAIDTPALQGSISLIGARIDDLYLKRYKETLDPASVNVELLRPKGAERAFYVQSGFIGQNIANLPGDLSVWTLKSGTVLSVGRDIVLGYDNGAGLSFERKLSIDKDYLITVTDGVTNASNQAVTLAPYANVQRLGNPKHVVVNAFEGGIGTFSKPDDATSYASKTHSYNEWQKKPPQAVTSTGGWIGITDKYWLAAVIPDQKTKINAAFNVQGKDQDAFFQAGYVSEAVNLAPGMATQITNRIFTGAKLDSLLQVYEKTQNIPLFTNAIDWGNIFWWISKPIFVVLDFLNKLFGNFGLALLGLTVIIRGIFYPFAHTSYESMIKMSALKPKMDAIKERYKDDTQKQQTEVMALYQSEKVNPVAGCLPMLAQIPVFLALSKVFFVTIEMRHTPFFGFVSDLSAREPSSVVNLFGLLPFIPATVPMIGGFLDGFLHIGIWAILYGFVMWVSQLMTPMATTDPMQKKIFMLMPIFIPFFMASLPVGLVIYYT
jgi:YidC/Oxa1 family membrane protein insertase